MADMYKATLVATSVYPSGYIIDFPDEIVTHSECFKHNLALGLDDMNDGNTLNQPFKAMVNGTTTKNRINLPFLLQTLPSVGARPPYNYLNTHGEYYHYTHDPIRKYATAGTIPSGFPTVETYLWGNTTVYFAKQAGCNDANGIHLSQQYEQTSINLGASW